MEVLITSGIEIQVETFYQPGYSNPQNCEFVHAYRISIYNHNNYPVQLMRRIWKITDANTDVRKVEGEGVVGRQPTLHPAGSYQYVSGCNLATAIGKMEGVYVFENKNSGKEFEVRIPVFKLIAPSILN
jgi:ApaG protein